MAGYQSNQYKWGHVMPDFMGQWDTSLFRSDMIFGCLKTRVDRPLLIFCRGTCDEQPLEFGVAKFQTNPHPKDPHIMGVFRSFSKKLWVRLLGTYAKSCKVVNYVASFIVAR